MRGRLPSCTAAEVARALEHGGFVFVHQKGSHRYFADPISGDILTTVPMHAGSGDARLRRDYAATIPETTNGNGGEGVRRYR